MSQVMFVHPQMKMETTKLTAVLLSRVTMVFLLMEIATLVLRLIVTVRLMTATTITTQM